MSRSSTQAVLMMPFGPDPDLALLRDELIEAAAQTGIHLEPVRYQYSPEPIISNIHRSIEQAMLVVAVLDTANPNVLYEAGYAKGVGLPVLLVARQGAVTPFNVAAHERVEYLGGYQNREMDLACFKNAFEHMVQYRVAVDSEIAAELAKLREALAGLDLEHRTSMFQKCVLWNLSRFGTWAETWNGRLFYRGRRQVLEIGTFILSNLRQCGFATFYYPGEASWQADSDPNTSDEYLQVTREVCRLKGVKITRVFVLDDISALDDSSFRGLVLDDADAGIDTRYILEDELPDEVPRDFAIWDNELFADVRYIRRRGKYHISSCTYYQDQDNLARARGWQELITARVNECSGLPSEAWLLRRSYTKQMECASRFMGPSQFGPEDSTWYHASWQYLRLSDVVSCPSWHSEFYRSRLVSWVDSYQDGEIRILISGLADYGMLYQALAALGPRRWSRCQFDVIDMSAVPVEMCKWLETILREESNGRISFRLEASQQNLLSRKLPSSTYHLVLADAFLTRFSQEGEKKAVIEEWARLLMPGGQAITTMRLKDSQDTTSSNDAVSMKRRFVQRVIEQWPLGSDDLEAARHYAEVYAENITSFTFDSVRHAELFFNSIPDIHVAEFRQALTPGEFHPTPYARIVLSKR